MFIYTCIDGAACNKSFMHITLVNDFQDHDVVTESPVIFMVDVSHVFKKIRNNIIKNGIKEKCTRVLTLPNTLADVCGLFVDLQNALQLHRKLTNENEESTCRRGTK